MIRLLFIHSTNSFASCSLGVLLLDFFSWNNWWKFVLPSWGALWYVPFLLCSNWFQLLNSASSRNWLLYCHSSQVLWHSKLGIKCPKAIITLWQIHISLFALMGCIKTYTKQWYWNYHTRVSNWHEHGDLHQKNTS